VPQEPHFWSRSILDNFRMGQPDLSFEQIVTACELADANEFISQLPDRFHTVLGEFGANLSVGQRQRLAIARALVNDPPILILDEATANLDPDSESRVLNRILAHRRGRTTILISHHPRVIQRADWLVWIDQGKLRLEGPIQEVWTQTGELMDFLMTV
jgi:ATP-binding cassette, subfamily C, bacterial